MKIKSFKFCVYIVCLGTAAAYYLFWIQHELDTAEVRSVSPSAHLTTANDMQQHDGMKKGGEEYHQVLSALEDLVLVASAIAKEKGMVLFTIINNGYIDLAFSWLCNTAVIGDIHQRVLFMATDVSTGQRLHQQWPTVHVVSLNDSRYDGALSFGRAGYLRLMVQRTQIIQRMLQSNVRLLLFEVDFVWLANPLPTILSQSDQEHSDIVAIREIGTPQTCGCFFLLNPTPVTKALWTRLTEQMDELSKTIANKSKDANMMRLKNDQDSLTALINTKYGGVNVSYLSERLFPNGQWYWRSGLRALKPDPLMIHNNYITGNDQKIRRAKRFGHWFLVQSSGSDVVCDMTKVRQLILK